MTLREGTHSDEDGIFVGAKMDVTIWVAAGKFANTELFFTTTQLVDMRQEIEKILASLEKGTPG